jgi:hypothetical protein
MIGAMLDLKRDHDVPSLAVHDSLIVPASKAELAIQALKSRFKAVTGKEAEVVLSSTTKSRRRETREREVTQKNTRQHDIHEHSQASWDTRINIPSIIVIVLHEFCLCIALSITGKI